MSPAERRAKITRTLYFLFNINLKNPAVFAYVSSGERRAKITQTLYFLFKI